MNSLTITLIIVFLLCSAGGIARTETVTYFSPSAVLLFAQSLQQEGDYARAAVEYQRYLLLATDATDRDAVLFQVGVCYRFGGQPQSAIHYFQRYLEEYPDSPQASHAYLLISAAYFDQSDYARSLETLEKLDSLDDTLRTRKALLRAANYIRLKEWKNATAVLQDIPDGETPLLKEAKSLRLLANTGKRIKRKSPEMAALMSAIVPGSGKIYAGRTMDGAMTMLTLALTGWQAYEGFKDKGSHSVRGWIYGTMFATFYAGNIYGSAAAVKISNDVKIKGVAEGVRLDVTLSW